MPLKPHLCVYENGVCANWKCQGRGLWDILYCDFDFWKHSLKRCFKIILFNAERTKYLVKGVVATQTPGIVFVNILVLRARRSRRASIFKRPEVSARDRRRKLLGGGGGFEFCECEYYFFMYTYCFHVYGYEATLNFSSQKL